MGGGGGGGGGDGGVGGGVDSGIDVGHNKTSSSILCQWRGNNNVRIIAAETKASGSLGPPKGGEREENLVFSAKKKKKVA